MLVFYDYRSQSFLTGRLKVDQSPIMEELTKVDIDRVEKVILISGLMSKNELDTAKEMLLQAGFYLADIIDANDSNWFQYIYIRPKQITYAESAEDLVVETDTVIVLPDGYIVAIERRGNKIVRRMKNGVLCEV